MVHSQTLACSNHWSWALKSSEFIKIHNVGNRRSKRAMKNTRQALNQVFDQDNTCKQTILCESVVAFTITIFYFPGGGR